MNAEQLEILGESILRMRSDACKLHEYVSAALFANTGSDAIRVRLALHNAISNCDDALRSLKELNNGS